SWYDEGLLLMSLRAAGEAISSILTRRLRSFGFAPDKTGDFAGQASPCRAPTKKLKFLPV
ncbi:MAG: hypothetical protein U9N80_09660, partial [Chloroflexota bacterium]|nr:hypothetical protein [Chloroflexota bacterium]